MKKSVTLSPAEYTRLREFVEEVQALIASDEEGFMVDVYESTETAAEILGLKQEEPDAE
jgi:UDP-N-acetylmuramate-alanine ligase